MDTAPRRTAPPLPLPPFLQEIRERAAPLEPPGGAASGLGGASLRKRVGADRLRLATPPGQPSPRGLLARSWTSARKALEAVPTAQRLLDRVTLGRNLVELERLEQLGYQGYLQSQLAHEGLDDSAVEGIIAEQLPSVAMSPFQVLFHYRDRPILAVIELQLATILRSLYSPRQLFERMVIFWSDHFNVHILEQFQPFLKGTDDREVIRAHALGKFGDLLTASAKSPAMLVYLDNFNNHKDHPNENYARELMELHTLGADNGYTEDDIKEVARCFTGWTVGRDGAFAFDPRAHDFGEKVVLGQTLPAGGGIEDGEAVLSILAEHPNTSRFIARKLCRYMVGYEPSDQLVERVARAYRNTGGNIRRMLKVLLAEGNLEQATPKLKRPYHLTMSAFRGLFAGIADPFALYEQLQRANHLPFTWAPPDGFPDDEDHWAGFILPRWNFAAEMLAPRGGTAQADLSWLDPSLGAETLVERIDLVLFFGALPETARGELLSFLRAAPLTEARLGEALGLALSSPTFQSY